MQQRYYALDVFRGATVALMIMVNNPGSWSHIFPPLAHAEWHGCTPTDLVFPFFLFAVGNAMSFVMPKFYEKGDAFFLKKVFKRTLVIFLIGILLAWSPFVRWDGDVLIFKTWEKLRILGVLQRIALAYCAASLLVYYFKARGAFVIGSILLLLYWFLSWWLGNTTDPYSLEGFWGTSIDRAILAPNHIYKGEGVPFDPEGIVSTLPAIVQVIFGYLAGQYIQQKGKSYEMLSNLFVAGLVLIVAGQAWGMVFPINKKLWTSSYVVYTSGLAICTIAMMIFMLEFKNAKGVWSSFFDVFGKNPLFIFVLSGFLPRLVSLIRIANGVNEKGEPLYLSPFNWFYKHVCDPIFPADPRVGSFVYALVMITMYWIIAYWLDKKRIYIKV
ncbi:MAG: acyltransferase family protein [Chitinophagaceae bacterium]